MKFLNNRVDITFPSEYTHWTIDYNVPQEGRDPWKYDYTDPNKVKRIYRSWLSIGFWRLYIVLYLWKVKPGADDYENFGRDSYGFTYFERNIHLHFGKITKVYSMPWDWRIVRHDLLLPDGSVYYHNDYKKGKLPKLGEKKRSYSWYEILHLNESPYEKSDVQTPCAEYVTLEHTTKYGNKQIANIELVGDEREWRWMWFKWLPFINTKQRVVTCSSDVELGERAGSWKGGMMGWSCEWKKGTTMTESFNEWYKNWDGK